MAWSFGDSFDLYAAPGDMINGYWDSQTTTGQSFVAGRFSGSQALNMGGSGGLVVKSSGVNDAVHHWWQCQTSFQPDGGAERAWARAASPAVNIAIHGQGYYLNFTSNSAYTPAATDAFFFQQVIEADMVADLAFGAAGAKTVTLSFWAWATASGLYGGSLKNLGLGASRIYPFTFTLPAGAWTFITITIPGDTTGAWALSGNGAGMAVSFDLGSGANYKRPAGAWFAGDGCGANGTVNTISTANAQLNITGVKLEIGSVATPFNRQSLAKSMADCQRYYQSNAQIMVAGYFPGASGSGPGSSFRHPVTMRADPTVGLGTPAYSNASALTVNHVDLNQIRLQATVTAAGIWYAVAQPLTLSAEL